MTDYLGNRSDKALDTLIRRSEAATKLNTQQQDNLSSAKRILAERSAAKVKSHFDIHRAITFLASVANEQRLCSYKELALECINNPKAEWSTYYRKLGGQNGLMQSIIRHCAANGLPHLASLVVRQDEVKAGPNVPPDREGEAEYGFKRGMVDEGLAKRGVDTDALVLEHRQACFAWREG
ncbi:hypothetical protein [Sagittula salina]|uniref:Uncharacterized protein n=1 Tax=Sagittula salina TaxID=2820268 RepID=A0A940MVZ8_9RHOB|nr:hypothetical protein [Sagittula salina]MBP0483884.1 hypothetical protein [Sagittula salina]